MRLRYIALLTLMVLVAGCIQLSHPRVDCNKLVDTKQRNECLYNRSIASLDTSSCSNIIGEALRVKCIDEVAVEVLDFYPCKQQDKQYQRDACETKVGEARKVAREKMKQTSTTQP